MLSLSIFQRNVCDKHNNTTSPVALKLACKVFGYIFKTLLFKKTIKQPNIILISSFGLFPD